MSQYQKVAEHQHEISLLGSTEALLGWDQETLMPSGAQTYRAEQLGQMTKLRHALSTDDRHVEQLQSLSEQTQLTAIEQLNVKEWLKASHRARAIPSALAVEQAQTSSHAMMAWQSARKDNDFSAFSPWLQKTVDLKLREAEAVGWAASGEAWDALAEEFDPGMTAQSVSKVFTPLRQQLVALVEELRGSATQPDVRFLQQRLPVENQKPLVKEVLDALGFDSNHGVIAVSTHPFCSGFHPTDVRVTTRYDEANFTDSVTSAMHECGHALYEQGLPLEHAGTPAGAYNGLSIHESQSRLWENQVGRSKGFLRWIMPKYKSAGLGNTELDQAYSALNAAKPSLIRVEADETTYNLHIMIRFELERLMLNGELAIEDLPEAWNQHYQDYLGITPPDNAQGCLQDVHWSMGAMGYFPTYTLGNLYSAQFYAAAKRELGDLEEQYAEGEFGPLLQWLRENVHQQGRQLSPAELCKSVTGEDLSANYLLDYLRDKLRPLYGLA